MTLPDVWRLMRYWKEHPPAGDLIGFLAQWVGWEPPWLRQFETDFAADAAKTAVLFKDPARFFTK